MVTSMTKKRRTRSIVKTGTYEQLPTGGLIISLASIADDFPAWGTTPTALDDKLRTFWPTEAYLASAVYTIATRNTAFSWTLQGPDRLVKAYREILLESWTETFFKWNLDYLTQNNGAFMEIIRETDSPESPCIGIQHLDAARCRRTGVAEWPVIYVDAANSEHRLAPHQVWATADSPSPVESMNGVGMCAVYRVLREANRMRDISIHDREKLSGNNPKGMILVNNIGAKQLGDVIKQHEDRQTQKGFVRYIKPAIYASLDPAKPASAQVVDFAAMPDGFNKQQELTWYITLLAEAFGCDYQDLAPLSSGNLGTSTQSQVLHQKSKGKGPAMYQKLVTHMMNWSGILPRSVEFEFDEQDVEADIQQQDLAQRRAAERQVYISTGVKSPLAVRTEMLQAGEITQEIFDLMTAEDQRRSEAEERQRASLADRLRSLQPAVQDESGPNGDITGAAVEDESGPTEGTEAKARKPDYADNLRRRLERRLEADMVAALKKAFGVLRDRIRAESRQEKAFKQLQDLPDDPDLWEQLRVIIRAAMDPNVRDVALAAAQYKTDMGLGVDMDRVDRDLVNFTRSYSNDWWKGLEDSTREGLRDALATWQESGLGDRGLPDLEAALEDIFFSPTRAKRIAVTEVTRIFDEGNRSAERTLGIKRQVWLTANDDLVCVNEIHYGGMTYGGCSELDGKVFAMEDGPYPVTDTHPNCRCLRTGLTDDGDILRD